MNKFQKLGIAEPDERDRRNIVALCDAIEDIVPEMADEIFEAVHPHFPSMLNGYRGWVSLVDDAEATQ